MARKLLQRENGRLLKQQIIEILGIKIIKIFSDKLINPKLLLTMDRESYYNLGNSVVMLVQSKKILNKNGISFCYETSYETAVSKKNLEPGLSETIIL